jgi:hypothetical protein
MKPGMSALDFSNGVNHVVVENQHVVVENQH